MTRDQLIDDTMPSSLHEAADLRALLQYNDRRFVQCAYLTLLKREADPNGLSFYVGRLRNGEPKIQILSEIYSSDEARAAGVDLPGLRRAIRREKLFRLPLIGKPAKMLFDGEGESVIETRLRVIEQQVFLLAQRFDSRGAQLNVVEGRDQSSSAADPTETIRSLEPVGFEALPAAARDIYFKLRIAATTHPKRNI
jgi:hypothetical protein